jgi:ubiquinone/menaquinone biosynthesis C-methylase UbiE
MTMDAPIAIAATAPGTRAVGAVGEFLSYLDSMSTILAAPKKASIHALGLTPGDAALDVGCGTGDEVRQLAELVGPTGHAIGIDTSEELLAEARARTMPQAGVAFVAADAHAMPFTDAVFAAARVERALQHMTDPLAVVTEMARVVRRGGRIVAMEPDWDTIVVSSADLKTTRAVVRAAADRVRHPDAGRRLPEWFVRSGIDVQRVDALAMPIRSLEVAEHVFDLITAAENLGGPIAQAWLDELRAREAHGAFVAAATGFGVIGEVR